MVIISGVPIFRIFTVVMVLKSYFATLYFSFKLSFFLMTYLRFSRTWPKVIYTFIMLNSASHEIFPAHKC